MSFVDEYSFIATAGKGGDGVVRWRREKFLPKGGPNGGDGGKGGDVYFEGVRDIMLLHRISNRTSYQAVNGEPGADNSKTGAGGADLVIKLPLGSVIKNLDTGTTVELLREGEPMKALAGGAGGHGNEHFKSSTNRAPQQATNGKAGETARFSVELRLIADVGLVGLPNAGKTSLLNALTNANAKVGDYPFTTLDPNLGTWHGYVLADIPGLIEGASTGKGLGHKFLRHISRTAVILHCISLERDDPSSDYRTIRTELTSQEGLIDKPEYVVFTKSDTMTDEGVSGRIAAFGRVESAPVLGTVSILDDASIKELADKLVRVLNR